MTKHASLTRQLVVLLTFLAAAMSLQAAVTATSVLDALARKINNAQSVTLTYSIVTSTDGSAVDGNMVMAREKFRIDNRLMTVWYDGVTQWTLDKRGRELTVTEPMTDDELMESNPFAIINHYRNKYTTRLLKSPKGKYSVELTPAKPGSGVKRAVLTVSAKSMTPERLVVTMTNGVIATVTVKSMVTGQAKAAEAFRADVKRMSKTVRINDLR